MHRHSTIAIVSVSLLLGLGCDSGGDKGATKPAPAAAKNETPSKPAAASKAAPSKPAPTEAANKEEASTTPVLEETELPGLGTLKMPKGYKSTAEKHWSFDLGNFESIQVSWEPHGAPNLEKAKSLSKILANAETVKSSTTLDSGFHEIERVREKDGYTFVVVFGPDWYVKCHAPAAHMETCREIVRSKS